MKEDQQHRSSPGLEEYEREARVRLQRLASLAIGGEEMDQASATGELREIAKSYNTTLSLASGLFQIVSKAEDETEAGKVIRECYRERAQFIAKARAELAIRSEFGQLAALLLETKFQLFDVESYARKHLSESEFEAFRSKRLSLFYLLETFSLLDESAQAFSRAATSSGAALLENLLVASSHISRAWEYFWKADQLIMDSHSKLANRLLRYYQRRQEEQRKRHARGAEKANAGYREAKSMACEIALERWSDELASDAEPTHIRDVVQGIKKAINADLAGLGLNECPTDKTLRDWVRPLVYSLGIEHIVLKGGRPKRSDR